MAKSKEKKITAKKTASKKAAVKKSAAAKKDQASETKVLSEPTEVSESSPVQELDQIEQHDVLANEDSVSVEPEIRPSLLVYIRATLQVILGWIKSHKLRSLLVLIVVVAVTIGLFMIIKPSAGELTNDQIVTQVNKELSISGDGNPVVLTVVDDKKVEQPFLEQAVNGDKVLLYYKVKKSVLFRPSEKRIIHHGTYTPPAAKVFLRGGTDNGTKLKEVRDKLVEVEDINLASQDSSPKQDYKGVTIVSVTDRYDDKIRELSQLFDVEISRLPAGESFPDADILIIVGD